MLRLLIPSFFLIACQTAVVTNTGDTEVSLRTDATSYPPGAEVVLQLTNNTSGELGYNLCHSGLQRLVSGAWAASQPGMDHVCTMELRLLQRGASATYRLRLPAALPAGQYRFTTTVEHMQSGQRPAAVSNVFTVSG